MYLTQTIFFFFPANFRLLQSLRRLWRQLPLHKGAFEFVRTLRETPYTSQVSRAPPPAHAGAPVDAKRQRRREPLVCANIVRNTLHTAGGVLSHPLTLASPPAHAGVPVDAKRQCRRGAFCETFCGRQSGTPARGYKKFTKIFVIFLTIRRAYITITMNEKTVAFCDRKGAFIWQNFVKSAF